MSNLATGKQGEQIGEAYLKKRGYQILARNVRSPFGEIDLVAKDAKTLVFVEIKTRRDTSYGFPEEAVDGRKKKRLIRLATWYLAHHAKSLELQTRFDVLAIRLDQENPEIQLIQNAFDV